MLEAMEIPHSILGPEIVDPQAALKDALAFVFLKDERTVCARH